MNNRILSTSYNSRAEIKVRPPIKNNLNEQLKIYYTYRNETIQNRLNNIENQSLYQ